MSFAEVIVQHFTRFVPSVLVDAGANYLFFWLPLLVLVGGPVALYGWWKRRKGDKQCDG